MMNSKFKKHTRIWVLILCLCALILTSLFFLETNLSSRRYFHTATPVASSANNSRRVTNHQGIRLRTNMITGFTSVKSFDGKFKYALCDLFNSSSSWKPGIVVMDEFDQALASWEIPETYGSSDLTNTFTSNIVVGDKNTEVFVLLAVKDLAKAINNAFVKSFFQPIYIVRLSFVPESRLINTKALIPFVYPKNSFGIHAWFSPDGKYSLDSVSSSINLSTANYHVGRLGYIHFLSYGHLFAYKGYSPHDPGEEFLMVPTLISRDSYWGGLYSPIVSSQAESEKCCFSQRKFWDLFLKKHEGKLVYEDAYGKHIYAESDVLASYAKNEILKMLTGDDVWSPHDSNDKKDAILMQPGWCVFRPFDATPCKYVSLRNKQIGSWRGDVGGVFTQFEIINTNKRRVIKAVRITSNDRNSLFMSPSHVVHFSASWNWFCGNDLNELAVLSPYRANSAHMPVSRYTWKISDYQDIVDDSQFHFSFFELNDEHGNLSKKIDIIQSNFTSRASTVLGASIPFLIFSLNGQLKIHTDKFTGSLGSSSRLTFPKKIFSEIKGVVAIVPFTTGNLAGEGFLVVAETGILTYRFYDSRLGLIEIDEEQFLPTEIETSALRFIYFHQPSLHVEENLVKVTLGSMQMNERNLKLRLFSLEWTDERTMLQPLECTEKTRVMLIDELPGKYQSITGRRMTTMLKTELNADFLAESFRCSKANKCKDFHLSVHHVSGGSGDGHKNKIAISLKIKTGKHFQTGFVITKNQISNRIWDTFVIYSGLSSGQEYFAVFKSHNEVKKMTISQYTVDEIYEMYKSPQKDQIHQELLDLVRIEPQEMNEGWKYHVRVVEANSVVNSLSLEAVLMIGSYLEPLKIKGMENSSVMVYNNVFHKVDYTWAYVIIAAVLSLIIILSLGIGIGLPMRKQQKLNVINAKLTNRRFDQLAASMASSVQIPDEYRYPPGMQHPRLPASNVRHLPPSRVPYYLPHKRSRNRGSRPTASPSKGSKHNHSKPDSWHDHSGN